MFLHQAQLFLQIAYAGAPLSGKTETLKAVLPNLQGRRAGDLVYSPLAALGRTLYFDWAHYEGGNFRGAPLHCQITSVPGQASLQRRRRLLIEDADAVVFVVDSQPDQMEANRRSLAELQPWLSRGKLPPIEVVYQANKRDLPGTLEVDEIRRQLGLSSDTEVYETSAVRDDGLRVCFVAAMRACVRRAELLHASKDLLEKTPDITTGEQLLERLRRAEDSAAPSASALAEPPGVALAAPSASAVAAPSASAVAAPSGGAASSAVAPPAVAPLPAAPRAVKARPAVMPMADWLTSLRSAAGEAAAATAAARSEQAGHAFAAPAAAAWNPAAASAPVAAPPAPARRPAVMPMAAWLASQGGAAGRPPGTTPPAGASTPAASPDALAFTARTMQPAPAQLQTVAPLSAPPAAAPDPTPQARNPEVRITQPLPLLAAALAAPVEGAPPAPPAAAPPASAPAPAAATLSAPRPAVTPLPAAATSLPAAVAAQSSPGSPVKAQPAAAAAVTAQPAPAPAVTAQRAGTPTGVPAQVPGAAPVPAPVVKPLPAPAAAVAPPPSPAPATAPKLPPAAAAGIRPSPAVVPAPVQAVAPLASSSSFVLARPVAVAASGVAVPASGETIPASGEAIPAPWLPGRESTLIEAYPLGAWRKVLRAADPKLPLPVEVAGAWQGRVASGWQACCRGLLGSMEAARSEFNRLVSWLMRLGRAVTSQRCVVLSAAGGGWCVWQLVHEELTLDMVMRQAMERELASREAVLILARASTDFVSAAHEFAARAIDLPVHLRSLAHENGATVYAGFLPQAPVPVSNRDPLAELASELRAFDQAHRLGSLDVTEALRELERLSQKRPQIVPTVEVLQSLLIGE